MSHFNVICISNDCEMEMAKAMDREDIDFYDIDNTYNNRISGRPIDDFLTVADVRADIDAVAKTVGGIIRDGRYEKFIGDGKALADALSRYDDSAWLAIYDVHR